MGVGLAIGVGDGVGVVTGVAFGVGLVVGGGVGLVVGSGVGDAVGIGVGVAVGTTPTLTCGSKFCRAENDWSVQPVMTQASAAKATIFTRPFFVIRLTKFLPLFCNLLR